MEVTLTLLCQFLCSCNCIGKYIYLEEIYTGQIKVDKTSRKQVTQMVQEKQSVIFFFNL